MKPDQQKELDHLVRCALTHANWIPYVTDKAANLAQQYPKRWGWLPLALSNALESSRPTP